MKIINGERFYTKNEVAQMVGRNPQMIHLWSRWSDELEERGEQRLIPKPMRLDNGYRYWSDTMLVQIINFANNIRYGDLKEFSRQQWGVRGEGETVENGAVE